MSVASASCKITNETSIFAVRTLVRPFAAQLGFSAEVIEELVVVVSELASNILKYGVRGRIDLHEMRRADGSFGIRIVAEDQAAAFDLAQGIRDGHDVKGKLNPALLYRRGGIGAGLGAVSRLSDGLEMITLPNGDGKQIIAWRVAKRPRRGSNPDLLQDES